MRATVSASVLAGARARARTLAVTSALVAVGCGPRADGRWIDDQAAVVRCTVAGASYTLPALVGELPAPATPTGLYARVLDPMALDDLGFTRDAVVCASLAAPSEVELAETGAALDALVNARAELDRAVAQLGPCACEAARELDRATSIGRCVGEPWNPECEVREFERRELGHALAPLDAALAAAKVPLVHWRLAGPADRPTRLLARRGDLLARHGGGSELFQRGEPVPARLNHVLLSALLQEPGVVAVARQDSGTALLVVRALDGQLVLDHFAYPPVDPQLHPLLAHLDNAQVDRYRAMLAAPADRRRLALDPAEGTLVELDAAALERVRTGHALASRLAAGGSEPVGERAPSIFDRVTFQVPFGHEGETAHARMQLSEHAVAWAQGEREDAMAPWVLASVGDPSAPAPDGEAVAPLDEAPDLWFGGASVVLEVMAAIERDAPGSLAGTRAAWTVSIPSGPLPGEFVNTPPSLKRLRERLSKRPHTLRGVLEASVLELTLAPG